MKTKLIVSLFIAFALGLHAQVTNWIGFTNSLGFHDPMINHNAGEPPHFSPLKRETCFYGSNLVVVANGQTNIIQTIRWKRVNFYSNSVVTTDGMTVTNLVYVGRWDWHPK